MWGRNQPSARRPFRQPLAALLLLLGVLALGIDVASPVRAAEVADLAVSLTDAPDPVTQGQPLTYQVTATNAGPDTAQNIQVSVPIPANTSYTSHSAGGASCITGTTLVCNFTATPSGGTHQLSLIVTVSAATPPGTIITGTASVTSTTATDPTSANNSASTTSTVQAPPPPPSADLAITGTVTPNPASNLDRRVYTFTVTNHGPDRSLSFAIWSTLRFNRVLFAVGDANCGPGELDIEGIAMYRCDFGPVDAGASSTVAIHVIPTAPFSIWAAVIDGDAWGTTEPPPWDPVPGNNQLTLSADWRPYSADLSLSVTDSPDPVQPGAIIRYEVIVTNNGPTTAENITVQFALPPQATLVSQTTVDDDGYCIGWGNTGHCLYGPGDGKRIILRLRVGSGVTNGTVLTLTASVPETGDPDPSNNLANATTTVSSSATGPPSGIDLTASISDSPDPVAAGSTITYTITGSHSAPYSVNSFELRINAVPHTTFVSATGAAASCNMPAAGASLTGGRCTWAAATMPGEVRTMTVLARVNPGTPGGTVIATGARVLINDGANQDASDDPNPSNNTPTTTTTVGGGPTPPPSPTPSVTPSPTPSPSPTPAPTPPACPKPGACTPAPAPSASPTPTPRPSATPSPTPTPTATPPACPKPGACPPPPGPTATPSPTPTPAPTPLPGGQPMTISGTATIAGQPAAKQTVQAVIGGVVCGQTVAGATGGFHLVVNSSSQQAGCGTNGASVTFRVGGVAAPGSTTFASGGSAVVNVSR